MSQSTKHVVDRFRRAMNDHNLDELVSCFHEDYRSVTPAHPERSFAGRAQVRANWAQLFETTPDLAVEFSRTMMDDDTAWIEMRMHGTQAKEELDVRGVVIKGISGNKNPVGPNLPRASSAI